MTNIIKINEVFDQYYAVRKEDMMSNWIMVMVCIFVVFLAYKWGKASATKRYEEMLNNQKYTYESLTESDIERINVWHKEYSHRISDPDNWDVIRKINKKVNKNMFFH